MEEVLLIESVRSRELLYNTKLKGYRDHNLRQAAWEEIGKDLNLKAETAKDAWDKLRRCFLNAINRRRSKKNGQSGKRLHSWKYEDQMSFLLPFIEIRNLHPNVTEGEAEEDSHFDGIDVTPEPEMTLREESGYIERSFGDPQADARPAKNEEVSHRLDFAKRRKRDVPVEPIWETVQATREYPIPRRTGCEESQFCDMDETDMFFLSMARMSKKLPDLDQARIKLLLSNAVLQAQIRLSEFQEHQEYLPSARSTSESSLARAGTGKQKREVSESIKESVLDISNFKLSPSSL